VDINTQVKEQTVIHDTLLNTQVKEQTVIFDEVSIRFFFLRFGAVGWHCIRYEDERHKVQRVMTDEDFILFYFLITIAGLARLRGIAVDINTEVKVQAVMIDEISTQVCVVNCSRVF